MSFDQLQKFFESTSGQVSTILVIVILFVAILVSGKKNKTDVRGVVLSAIFVALYVALNQVIILRMPQGGSITAFSMLPITLCAYVLGVRRGMMAGMCAGLVELIFNPYVIHPLQLLLDYPLAVGALGFSGLFRNKKHGLFSGYLFGVFCRYICTFLSGVVFFGEYAPEGFSAFSWSLYYNIIYIGSEAALTFIIILLPPIKNSFQRLKLEIETS
ncbi:MAG TPA: energy-coupled thiamine transporter ThiT [Anaerovoracaceae bacterium]|nr:energy-coupled thiamine transporter ThiT [Anaerovoracaceae bacterium]